MRKAIIFHGTDCKPDDFWYKWLGDNLEKRGFSVEIPSYPEINHTPINEFLLKIMDNHSFDSETIIIGHSAGGPLILSILEKIDAVLPQAILVAGYSYRLPDEQKDPVLQDSYNWEKIRKHVNDIVFINSVNDPWGCNDEQGRFMFNKLGGTQIVRNEGHFGSTSFNQPYKEFPLIAKLVND